jgi:hypothetical protein
MELNGIYWEYTEIQSDIQEYDIGLSENVENKSTFLLVYHRFLHQHCLFLGLWFATFGPGVTGWEGRT